jgi:uncharacterized membrane protein (DUF4010 family)
MIDEAAPWPYAPTFARLALALAIGLFVGIERERRGKEAGSRTFAFAALLGAVGGLIGPPYGALALCLLGVLVILLNVETFRTGEGAEITTSAALFVTGFAGILAGQGHTFTPTVLGVVTAALLAWKEPLTGFSRALSEAELRSAVALAIITFVVYPVLPAGSVDPWQLVEPRDAWITVILIAALGFTNYVLLKIYGARGIEFTGFFGGLVNSTVTVAELANRASSSQPRLSSAAYRGVLLATAAMLARNAFILGLFAPSALAASIVPFGLMLAAAAAAAWLTRLREHRAGRTGDPVNELPLTTLVSPFALSAAIKFALIFLALKVAGTLATGGLGLPGFYAVSVAGGIVSSASAVASAAALSGSGTLSPQTAGLGAVVASMASAMVHLTVVARIGNDRKLTLSIASASSTIVVLGMLGAVVPRALAGLLRIR